MMIGLFGMLSAQRERSSDDPYKRRFEKRFSSHARPLNMRDYTIDSHGSIRHRKMRRPPNMSARQWKRFYKAMRRVGKLKAAA